MRFSSAATVVTSSFFRRGACFYVEKGINAKPVRCQRCREKLKNDHFETALKDPSKRFLYKCDLCHRSFVLSRQINAAHYVCPVCAPNALPQTEIELNKYLGYPR